MMFNKNLKNVLLVIFATLILSACSTAKKSGEIDGDVYTGTETVKYLASGVKAIMKEGNDQPSAYVLLEFPDIESAENWYEDPKYKPLIDLRNSGGRSEIFIIPGDF